MRFKLRWNSFLPAAFLAAAAAFAITLPVSADNSASTKAAANTGINLTMNGKAANPKTPPFLDKGTVYLPVRDMGEVLGTLVSWNVQAKTVTMRYPKLTVKLPLARKALASMDSMSPCPRHFEWSTGGCMLRCAFSRRPWERK